MIDILRTRTNEDIGIVEGDYNIWTKKWIAAIPDNVAHDNEFDAWIDDMYNLIYLEWIDANNDFRWGVFKTGDFSTVFLSASGSGYLSGIPYLRATHITPGTALFGSGGVSRSARGYMLLLRNDYYTFEIWRNGSVIKTHDVRVDFHTANCYSSVGGISLTAKYLLFQVLDYDTTPNSFHLMLYEGSKI